MPMVAATLVTAISTGMPAAISAPNASSISTSVTGMLIFSAEDRSSATRSSMLSSMVMSPAWRMSRPGCSSCTRSVTSTSGRTSSWSLASWISMRSADWSGFHCGSDTASTPSTAAMSRRISAAADSAACWSTTASPRAVMRTFSVSAPSRPAASTIASARPDSPRR